MASDEVLAPYKRERRFFMGDPWGSLSWLEVLIARGTTRELVDDVVCGPPEGSEFSVTSTVSQGWAVPTLPQAVQAQRDEEDRTEAADYGQHTDEVLQELGYGDEDLVEVRIEKAIW